MTQPSSEQTFRDLADTEPNGAVYAGPPRDRFRNALRLGRVSVDIGSVPEDKRQEVYEEIVALVRRRSGELRNGAPVTTNAASI